MRRLVGKARSPNDEDFVVLLDPPLPLHGMLAAGAIRVVFESQFNLCLLFLPHQKLVVIAATLLVKWGAPHP